MAKKQQKSQGQPKKQLSQQLTPPAKLVELNEENLGQAVGGLGSVPASPTSNPIFHYTHEYE